MFSTCLQGVIRVIVGLDREVNDFLVVQLQAVDDGTDPGPQTGHASVSQLAPNMSYISTDFTEV